MKLNRILAIFLSILMICSVSGYGFAAEASDVIRISSLEEFLSFAENCQLDSYSKDQHFLLTCDIDLTGTDFEGIPIFCGTFDGSYHTIKGLDIRSAGTMKGLFRRITATGTVKNLQVEGNVIPTGSRSKVGGIAGINEGLIESCTFRGTVIGASEVGGIAGINEASGLIRSCETEGLVSAHHFAGGIAGSNAGSLILCANRTDVNTTAQQNQIDISDITLENFTSTESTTTTTDIGGIAGASSGTILQCENHGSVGYKHMGYNVGGIVGMQSGYLADCENYGPVCGRKEVGGIAGQQEPQVLVRYEEDSLQVLKAQFSVLSELVHHAADNGKENTTNIRNLLHKMETYVTKAEKAIAILEEGLENPDLEKLESYLDALESISEALEGLRTTLRSLWTALDETMTDLDQDMAAISEQITAIEITLDNAQDQLGGKIVDISDQDTEDNLISKIHGCTNYGTVFADMNAGGIVGAIVFENDLDPEEDISIVGDQTLNAVGQLRSVVRNCTNSGTVTAKNQRIGGIVGWLTIGLVKACNNTGNLENPTADHVGGIAGESDGYIRDCHVKSKISGDSFVGGIAGSGVIASDCLSMVQLQGNEQVGSIFGACTVTDDDVADAIIRNYYLQADHSIGAIDGISYDGCAQGLNLADFLAMDIHALFQVATVTFIADGEVVYQQQIPIGTTFQNIPDVPQKHGFTAYWEGLSETDLQNVMYDLQVQATYIAYSATIQSDVTDTQGRPILLLLGDFGMDDKAFLTEIQSFAGLKDGETLIQGWELHTEDCIDIHSGRLLIPAGTDMDQAVLLVRDLNGNWMERDYSVNGSYIVFALGSNDDAVVLVETPREPFFTPQRILAAAIGGLTVLVVFGTCFLIRKRRRTQKPANQQALITENPD